MCRCQASTPVVDLNSFEAVVIWVPEEDRRPATLTFRVLHACMQRRLEPHLRQP